VFYNLSRLSNDHWWSFVWQSCKLLLNNLNKINKYPARCKSVDKNLAINVIQTAKNWKYMHIGFSINVIQTAKYRKYMHIWNCTCFGWKDNWCDTDGWKSILCAHQKAYCKCTLFFLNS
jgi:hypothetical protein